MVIVCAHVFIGTFCPSDKLLCQILCCDLLSCDFLSYMFCQNAKLYLWLFVLFFVRDFLSCDFLSCDFLSYIRYIFINLQQLIEMMRWEIWNHPMLAMWQIEAFDMVHLWYTYKYKDQITILTFIIYRAIVKTYFNIIFEVICNGTNFRKTYLCYQYNVKCVSCFTEKFKANYKKSA
jgi:hypothetical protein